MDAHNDTEVTCLNIIEAEDSYYVKHILKVELIFFNILIYIFYNFA